jgi:hypothetical protein
MKIPQPIVAFAACLLCLSATAQELQWRLDRDRDAIKVFSRKVEGSDLRAVRAETHIASNIIQVRSLLADVTRRPSWDSMCGIAKVIEQANEQEDLIYLLIDMPWPFHDRDMVLRRSWSSTDDPASMVLSEAAISGRLPAKSEVVRITHATSRWQLSPASNNATLIVTELYLDPGGPLPSWLLNQLAVNAPFDALHQIRTLLEQEQ